MYKKFSTKSKKTQSQNFPPVSLLNHVKLKQSDPHDWSGFWFRYLEAENKPDFQVLSDLRIKAVKCEQSQDVLEYLYQVKNLRETHKINIAQLQENGSRGKLFNKSKLKNNEQVENDENEDPSETDEDIFEVTTAFEELISGDTKHKNAFDWKNPYSSDYLGGISKGYSLDYENICMLYNYCAKSVYELISPANPLRKSQVLVKEIGEIASCLNWIKLNTAEFQFSEEDLTHDLHAHSLEFLRLLVMAEAHVVTFEIKKENLKLSSQVRLVLGILDYFNQAETLLNQHSSTQKQSFPKHSITYLENIISVWKAYLDFLLVQYLMELDSVGSIGNCVFHVNRMKQSSSSFFMKNFARIGQKFDDLVSDNNLIYFAEEVEYKIEDNPDLGKLQMNVLCKDDWSPDSLFGKLEGEKKVPLDFN